MDPALPSSLLAAGGSPGALIGEATVSATSTYGFGHDDENQIMFGSVFHVLTGYGWYSFNGPVFSGFIAGTAWTDSEATAWLSNPYELLSWSPPAPPLITTVTDDAGAVSSGVTVNDPDLTVQVSLSGTSAVAGDVLQLYDGTGTGSLLGNRTPSPALTSITALLPCKLACSRTATPTMLQHGLRIHQAI